MSIDRNSPKRKLVPYVFLAPAFAVLSLIVLYPLINDAVLSLIKVRLLKGGAGEFVGVEHYAKLFASSGFRSSIWSSVYFVVLSLPMAFLPSLVLALLLNQVRHGRALITAALLIPWAISPVVTGYIWRWLFHDSFGAINYLLQQMRLIDAPIAWLAEPRAAMVAVCVANAWRFMPYMVIMLLAGLQAISRELYEAAEVDGANGPQRFWHVTLPQLRHVVTVVLLFSVIWMANDFALIYVMTEGGPANATQVLPITIYRIAFEQLRLGKGAAASMILMIFLFAASLVFVRVLLRREHPHEA